MRNESTSLLYWQVGRDYGERLTSTKAYKRTVRLHNRTERERLLCVTAFGHDGCPALAAILGICPEERRDHFV